MTSFSGSHENGVMGVVNGTFDAAATAWNGEKFNYPDRMAAKGMIPAGATRIVWKSPKMPYAPWTLPTRLPEQMRKDIKQAILDMKSKDPETYDKLLNNRSQGFIEVDHAIYEPIIRMIKANQDERKK